MKFTLYFIEWHGDIEFWQSAGYKLDATDGDYGEFEHSEEFEADSIEEAKKKVYELEEMGYNSSGVFNVYHDNKLVFTEADTWHIPTAMCAVREYT